MNSLSKNLVQKRLYSCLKKEVSCLNEGSLQFRYQIIRSHLLSDNPYEKWTYEDLDYYQRMLYEQILEGSSERIILLSELEPVVTMGRQKRDFSYSHPKISYYETDRGGKETYHGPGQWVLFPVLSLKEMTGNDKGVKDAVKMLLDAGLNAIKKYTSKKIEKLDGEKMGLWTDQGKIASVGIRIQRGIVLHGLGLNGFQTPESFQGIHPCGLDAVPDFVFDEPSDSPFNQLGETLVQSFVDQLKSSQNLRSTLDEIEKKTIYPTNIS